MRMLRRPELRVLTIASAAAALAIVSLCLLLLLRTGTTEKFREQTVANCQAINGIKEQIRATFMDARDRALARTDLDATIKEAIRRNYDREIDRYKADDCPTH